MTETYGYDKTPTPPRDYDVSKVPSEIKKRATWVKTKFTGEDVAEAYGQAMEITGIYSDQAKQIAQQTKTRQDNLETQTAQSVAQMEADKNTIVANATVDSEVILARGGKPTLQARLDETTAQLAHTKEELSSLYINVLYPPEGVAPLVNDGVTDNSQLILGIFNYIEHSGVRNILFPRGVYRFTETLVVPHSVRLTGVKIAHIYNGGGSGTTLLFDQLSVGIEVGNRPYVTIENLHLDGNGTTDTVINFGFFAKMENVTITNAIKEGGKIPNGQNNIILNCSFSGNIGNGLYIADSVTTTRFTNCYFRENGENGFKGVTSGCYFLNCTFESNIGNGVFATRGSKLAKLQSCYFEANAMPNGSNMRLENGDYNISNTDFGSLGIVRVASVFNSTVVFDKSRHIGNPEMYAVDFDANSRLTLIDSFLDYPYDPRTIIPTPTNVIRGAVPWNLGEALDTIVVDLPKPLPTVQYLVQVTPDCREKMTLTITARTFNSFTIKIHDKPTGANGSILWRVEY